MAMIEVKEQCKGCFHYQVCANVLKQQLFIREVMLKEENPKCEQYIPTADVVEVVRCKDCKHYKPYDEHAEDFDGKCILRWCATDETEFCSYGERRDTNGQTR